MEQSASADRLDPALKRDLFFADLAATRREIRISGGAAIFMFLVCGVGLLRADDDGVLMHMLSTLGNSVILVLLVVGGAFRRQGSVTLRSDGSPIRWRGLKALELLLAQASRDPDLSVDPRLEGEVARARRVRLFARSLVAGLILLTLASVAVLARKEGNPFPGLFQPAPSPTVELVDVVLVPWSADFHGAITVDVTGGSVTQIAPYDAQRAARVNKFRAFEAIGKFLVAGGPIEFSQTGWLDRFKASWMRPIDIGTSGDFLIVDVDPRSHDIRQDQIAGAVVGGKYYSRKDIRAKGR